MINEILNKEQLSREDLITLLKLEKEEDLQLLYEKAYEVKEKYIGKVSHYRGLIEFSNYCIKDCKYCGIRKSNQLVDRFSMDKEEILKMMEMDEFIRYNEGFIQLLFAMFDNRGTYPKRG